MSASSYFISEKWLDIVTGIFGPVDRRLPLRGDVGLEDKKRGMESKSLHSNGYGYTTKPMVQRKTLMDIKLI